MPDKRDAITVASLVTNGFGWLGDVAFRADVNWLEINEPHELQTASILTASQWRVGVCSFNPSSLKHSWHLRSCSSLLICASSAIVLFISLGSSMFCPRKKVSFFWLLVRVSLLFWGGRQRQRQGNN